MKSKSKILLFFMSVLLLFIVSGCKTNETVKKEYTVDFYVNEDLYESQKVLEGNKLEKPLDPVMDGFEFNGWYVGDEKWMFSSGLIVSDMRLDAKFTSLEVSPPEGIEPVYQGMSIESNESLALSSKRKSDFQDSIDDIIGVETTEKVEYFASKGEKFNIIVHLYNPSCYEILSFTLNDYKYQSFEFKEGSNSTQLIIEVDAGMVSGLKEYTIDAIKYIDGTEIKDVKMEGEKTIKAGVRYEIVPSGTVSQTEIKTTSFKLVVDVKDANSLINTNNGIFMFLFDGKNIVSQIPLNLGVNVVEVDNLLMGTEYAYKVVAVYDDYSGNGKRANELAGDTFTTISGYLLDTLEVEKDSIKLSLNKEDENASFKNIALYLNNELVSEKEYSEEVLFENLLSDNVYNVVLTYSYMNDNKEMENEVNIEVKTEAKESPVISINSLLSGKRDISYKFEELDNDNVKKSVTVDLYQGINKVSSSNDLESVFNDLYSSTTYKLVLTYEYDLNDGNGSKFISQEYESITKDSILPQIDISYSTDSDSLTYNANVTDADSALIDVLYKLYQGDILVGTSSDIEKEFTNLKSNTEYKLVVDYSYNLNDGLGVIHKEDNYTIVLGKEVPTFALTAYFISDSSIEYNLLISDPNASGRLNMLALYQGSLFIERLDETTSRIDDLQSNTDYIIKANYVYDFDDGLGSREINYEYSFKTLKVNPTVAINSANVSKNSIEIAYDISDIDNALDMKSLELMLNGEVIRTFNSTSQVMFDNLLSDNLYTIKATFTKNLNNGEEEFVRTIQVRTEKMETPTVDIDLVSTKTTVSYSYSVNDTDNISTLKSVDIYYNGVKQDIEALDNIFSDLYSDSNYEVVVTLLCDYQDGKAAKEEEYKASIKTDSYQDPTLELDLTSTAESINYNLNMSDAYDLINLSKINVYKGSSLVREITNFDSNVIDGLLSNTVYRVEVVYEYDLNDNRGKHVVSVDRTYSTLAYNVVVVGYEVLNEGSPKTNEDISLRINLENESRVLLEYVVVNGERLSISGGDKYNNIIVVVESPRVSGPFNVSVTRMGYILNGIEVEQDVETLEEINIQIMSRLDIISVSTLDMSSVMSNSSNMGLEIIIDNPNNYIINSFTINTWYGEDEYDAFMIDSNHIYLPDFIIRNKGQWVSIKSVSYEDASGNDTTRNYVNEYNMNITYLETSASKVRLITSPEEFINMESGYAYELANDIDMSGYNWSVKSFSGYFDGKGHSIKNLTMVQENEYDHSDFGIFSQLEGEFKNVYFDSLYLNLTSRYINCYLLYGNGNPVLNNVLFSGDVVINTSNSYMFEMPKFDDDANVYIVEELTLNGTAYVYENTITNEVFTSESFRNDTLAWDFIDKNKGTYNGLVYTIYDNSYIFIDSYVGEEGEIVVPNNINGLPVLGISDLAFEDNGVITSLTISENVFYLGVEFVTDCENLETIVIENLAVGSNESKAFFTNCDLPGLKNLSITSENQDAYIYFDDSFNCENLENIYLDGVRLSFNNSESLKTLTIKNTTYSGSYSSSSSLESLVLENVDIIEGWAFAHSSLENVSITGDIIEIGEYAFYYCTLLENFAIPNSVEIIKNRAFCECNSLDYITVPRTVLRIDEYAFSMSNAEIICSLSSKPSDWKENWAGNNSSVNWNCVGISSINDKDYILYNDNTAKLYNYSGSDSELSLPSEITNNDITYTVTSIGSRVFYSCDDLVSVVIPDTVLSIGEEAFYECDNLESVDLPSRLTSIEDRTFRYCRELRSIEIPSTVTSIGKEAFDECNNLTYINLPDSLTSIGADSFRSCHSLSRVYIPSGVTEIERWAFGNGCSMTIYCSVSEELGTWSDEWNYSDNCPVYWNICGLYTNSDYSYILYNDNTAEITKYNGSETSVTLPSEVIYNGNTFTVTSIGESAFYNCDDLVSIVIPNTVTSIGKEAFYECDNLESVDLPSGLTSIEDRLFSYCRELRSIEIPSTVTSIGESAFFECQSLNKIYISNVVTEIKGSAFAYCRELKELFIPESVVTIEDSAFCDAYSLQKLYIGADSIPTTWSESWINYTNYTLVNNCETIVTSDNFEYVLYKDNTASLAKYNGTEDIISVASEISYNDETYVVDTIDSNAFGMDNYDIIVLPGSITSVGNSTIYTSNLFIDGVTELNWGSEWGYVSNRIVYNFDKLYENEDWRFAILNDGTAHIVNYKKNTNTFTIPSTVLCDGVSYNVTSIGSNAFINNYLVEYVIVPNNIVEMDASAMNFGSMEGTVIYIEAASAPSGWSDMWNGNSLNKIYWNFDSFYTNGDFEYALFNDNKASIIKYNGDDATVNLASEILCNDNIYTLTSIDNKAFMNNTTLTSITLAETIEHIGAYAFYGCTSLSEIEFPASVESIGAYAFLGCSGIDEVYIPETVEQISYSAFGESVETFYCQAQSMPSSWDSGWNSFYANNILWNFISYYEQDGLKFILHTDLSAQLIEYNEELENIILPSEITYNSNTYRLKSIDNNFFEYNDYLVSIVIPEGVEEIGDYAFRYCRGLETITLPSTLKTIGSYAFEYCQSLLSVDIPDNVSTIGVGAFKYCECLESVELPSSLTVIESRMFVGCYDLSSIEIPNGVTTIKNAAFESCHKLRNIQFGSNLTTIEEYAFNGCSLGNIFLPSNVKTIGCNAFTSETYVYSEARKKLSTWDINWISESDRVYWNVNGLYSEGDYSYALFNNNTASVLKYNGSETSVTLPSEVIYNENTFTVTSIGSRVFYNCDDLVSVVIPDTVTSIGKEAFYECDNLESVDLPSGLTSIEDRTFSYCRELRSIEIPSTLTSIGAEVFFECRKLEDINLPNALTRIGNNAFAGCNSFEKIYIPNGVIEIGRYAFGNGCSMTIYCSASKEFSGWDNEWNYSDSCPVYWNISGLYTDSDYSYILYNDNTAGIAKYSGSETDVNLPSEVIYNGNTFTVTSIDNNAFNNCLSITSVVLPNTIKTIGNYAFTNCDSLNSIIIPSSVTSVGEGITNRNSIAVYCEASSLPSGWKNNWIDENATVIWNVSEFITKDDYSYILFNDYSASLVKYNGSDTEITLSNEVVYNDVVYTLTRIGNNAFDTLDFIESIFIPDSVTSIGEAAFRNCRSLYEVTLPSSLDGISDYLFYECRSLIEIDLPNDIAYIGSYAFYNCYSLAYVNLPNSVLRIGDCAFHSCNSLLEIDLPDNITYIGSSAFWNCYRVTSLELPSSLQTIESNAFSAIYNLELVVVPANVSRMGYEVFNASDLNIYCQAARRPGNWELEWHNNCTVVWNFNCMYTVDGLKYALFNDNTAVLLDYSGNETNLTVNGEVSYNGNTYQLVTIASHAFESCDSLISVVLPNTVTTIGSYAFNCCYSLTSIVLPTALTTIESHAFDSCTSLNEITLPNSLKTIEDYAFNCCYNLTNIFVPANVIKIGEGAFGNGYNPIINCEASSKPNGWVSSWSYNGTVNWGCTQ